MARNEFSIPILVISIAVGVIGQQYWPNIRCHMGNREMQDWGDRSIIGANRRCTEGKTSPRVKCEKVCIFWGMLWLNRVDRFRFGVGDIKDVAYKSLLNEFNGMDNAREKASELSSEVAKCSGLIERNSMRGDECEKWEPYFNCIDKAIQC